MYAHINQIFWIVQTRTPTSAATHIYYFSHHIESQYVHCTRITILYILWPLYSSLFKVCNVIYYYHLLHSRKKERSPKKRCRSTGAPFLFHIKNAIVIIIHLHKNDHNNILPYYPEREKENQVVYSYYNGK